MNLNEKQLSRRFTLCEHLLGVAQYSYGHDEIKWALTKLINQMWYLARNFDLNEMAKELRAFKYNLDEFSEEDFDKLFKLIDEVKVRYNELTNEVNGGIK